MQMEKWTYTDISIHALRGEGDSIVQPNAGGIRISIHALRGEGDWAGCHHRQRSFGFLSTPSVGRATSKAGKSFILQRISIHALRGEGDG